jgi:HAD superfamily hydrolase (TIGR01509 family)
MGSVDLSFIHTARAFIIDMDGLLIDTERLGYEAWRTTMQAHGLDIDPVFPQLIGKGVTESDRILSAYFGPACDVSVLRALRNQRFDELITLEGIPQKEGAHVLLSMLSARGIPTALATSSVRDIARSRLSVARCTHVFNVEVFREDVTQGKPFPDLFLLAAQQLGISADSCVVLEDSHAGIEAALAAGARPIMVPDIVPAAPWVFERSVPVISSLLRLVEMLRSRRGGSVLKNERCQLS